MQYWVVLGLKMKLVLCRYGSVEIQCVDWTCACALQNPNRISNNEFPCIAKSLNDLCFPLLYKSPALLKWQFTQKWKWSLFIHPKVYSKPVWSLSLHHNVVSAKLASFERVFKLYASFVEEQTKIKVRLWMSRFTLFTKA